jgi:carbonic anhydrase
MKQFRAAVVAVLFELTSETTNSWADDCFQRLFNGSMVDTQSEFIDHLNLIHRYVYKGSLTTPPYSQYLFWNVPAKIVKINRKTLRLFRTEEEIKSFNTKRTFGEPNRKVQRTYKRRVFEVTRN